MDFTREPIIETVITPKEGCKLVVRSSKSGGQEEYFVDSLEVVSFGRTQFLRSTERPKAFLVPASDYEILEVREARMVLKNVGLDRSIKIGGGREGHPKPQKEPVVEKVEAVEEEVAETAADSKADNNRLEKKRDRRRHYRRRRGREDKEEGAEESVAEGAETSEEVAKVEMPVSAGADELDAATPVLPPPSVIPSLLPPPTMLISETIARYKDNDLFKGAFYTKAETLEEEETESEVAAEETSKLPQPENGSYEMSEEEEEEIYRQRRTQFLQPREDQQPFVEAMNEDISEDVKEESSEIATQEVKAEEHQEEQQDSIHPNGNQ